jgi:predicted component of type VI protein secretion system
MRFRLRYLHHDLELHEGEFSLGRSAECQLSLDDPLVSRRHAVLVVTRDRVTLEDLQSRNGVHVNGERIAGKVALRSGDTIAIGEQELTLVVGRDVTERDILSTTQAAHHTLPKIAVHERDASGAGRPSTDPPSAPGEPTIDTPPDRRAQAFSLLGGLAEKALAMGRAEEAERLLASALSEVVESSRAGTRPSQSQVDAAARLAAKLATATAKGTWVDYVIDLYRAEGRPCPAPVIDELYGALRKVSAIDLVRLRAYVSAMRERQGALGPADKFLLQRIEGLERLAALR